MTTRPATQAEQEKLSTKHSCRKFMTYALNEHVYFSGWPPLIVEEKKETKIACNLVEWKEFVLKFTSDGEEAESS